MLDGDGKLGAVTLIGALARSDRDRHADEVEAVTRGVILVGTETDPPDLVEVLEEPLLLVEVDRGVDPEPECRGCRGTGGNRREIVGRQTEVAERALGQVDLRPEERGPAGRGDGLFDGEASEALGG